MKAANIAFMTTVSSADDLTQRKLCAKDEFERRAEIHEQQIGVG